MADPKSIDGLKESYQPPEAVKLSAFQNWLAQRDPVELVLIGAGVTLAIILSGGLAAAGAAALAGAAGATALGSFVAATVVGGAVGNLAAYAADSLMRDQDMTAQGAGSAALYGAAEGLLLMGVFSIVGRGVRAIRTAGRLRAQARWLNAVRMRGGVTRGGQYAGGLDEAAVAGRFDELANFRRNSPNLPDALTGIRSVDDVALMIETNNGRFFGENAWIGRSDVSYEKVMKTMRRRGMKPNAVTPTHAEGGAAWNILMSDSVDRGLGVFVSPTISRGHARVFVDATFCGSCGTARGMENLIRGLGFESADAFIRLPTGHLVSGRIY